MRQSQVESGGVHAALQDHAPAVAPMQVLSLFNREQHMAAPKLHPAWAIPGPESDTAARCCASERSTLDPCGRAGVLLRRSTSDMSLAFSEDTSREDPCRSSLTLRDFARRSVRMLAGNPEGSYVDGEKVYVQLDLMMGASCMAFGLLAALYALLGEPFIASIMLLVTATSTLSDAVVHGCAPLDVLDRYVATGSAAAIASYSFRWLQDEVSWVWLVAAPVQSIQLVAPIWFLAKSRAHQIGSEEWRIAHSQWHWAAVACAASASLLSRFCFSAAPLSPEQAPAL